MIKTVKCTTVFFTKEVPVPDLTDVGQIWRVKRLGAYKEEALLNADMEPYPWEKVCWVLGSEKHETRAH